MKLLTVDSPIRFCHLVKLHTSLILVYSAFDRLLKIFCCYQKKAKQTGDKTFRLKVSY